MRIVHTADWHLGDRLGRIDRTNDLRKAVERVAICCTEENADVLLVAGSRMGNLDVPYDSYWGDPEGKRLIQIDIDPRHFGVTRPLHLGILADAGAALEGIAARLRATDLGTRDQARTRSRSQSARSGRHR